MVSNAMNFPVGGEACRDNGLAARFVPEVLRRRTIGVPYEMPASRLPRSATTTERPAPSGPPHWSHPGWTERHPWLIQGITGRGADEGFDLSPFGVSPAGDVVRRWAELRRALGVTGAVHAPQQHGVGIRHHTARRGGLHLVDPCDGHLTRTPGLLVTVAVADCVPITLVAPEVRAVAVLHAGWRGVAAGMAGAGLAALADRFGVGPAEVEAHLGPAICGTCYEVGPEVHAALGVDVPDGNRPVDLRGVITRDLVAAGLPLDRITTSTWCTRCGDAPFFSHRAGASGRQVSYVAVAP